MSARDETAPTRVTVTPADALRARPLLFSALERAFPVRFVEGPADRDQERHSFTLSACAPDGPPGGGRHRSLHFGTWEERSGQPASVRFSDSSALASMLRGCVLTEDRGAARLTAQTGAVDGEVLASVAGRPVWVRRGSEEWSALGPAELDPVVPLRERLKDGSFLDLLPLVHWLRTCAPSPWEPPPFRAAFIFDDPNLHWRSYGFIRYRELADHAREHGYAATMATVPRDLWAAHASTVSLFRHSEGRLSLALHGNDHVKRELRRELPVAARRALLAQALLRVERFERRWGLPVARVMVPPHGATSREIALEMPKFEIEAMTDSRPYPWLHEPPPDEPLAGWGFVDVVDGGLPVIPRYHLAEPRADLVLRAFLGQPVVLYGHHEDVSSGLQVLADAAAQVNALGDVRWLPLGRIARTNFETRRDGSTLHVRLANGVVELDVPEGIDELVLDISRLGPVAAVVANTGDGERRAPSTAGAPATLPASPGAIRLTAVRSDALDHRAHASRRTRLWPLMRRTATEARDRALPTLAHVTRR